MSNKLHAGKIFPGLVLAKWYAEADVSRVEALSVSQNERAEGFRKGGGGGGGRGCSPCLGCHALRVAQCGKHLIAIFQRFSASVKSIDPKP